MERPRWSDDEVEAVRQLATDFFEKEVLPNADTYREQGHPDRAAYRRAGELGLLGMSVPARYGGGGGVFAHEVAVLEQQLRTGDTSLGLAVHSGIVPHYLLAYATEEQKARWLPRLCSGQAVGALAMTEPETGSDLQAIRTRAERQGDGYVINGSKTFITNGFLCNLVVIAVKTGTAAGASGISLIVAEVDDGTPGFRRGRILKKMGQKGQDTAELFFDGLRVPAANLLGPAEGQGFAQMMAQLPQERLITAALAQAGMEAALASTVAYTKQRHAFGAPLIALQNTRFELAACATNVAVCRAFLDECIVRHMAGGLDAVAASMAKYWLSEQATAVVDRCLQLFGGYGWMDEYPISRLYTDLRVLRILAGTNEIMKELIARSL